MELLGNNKVLDHLKSITGVEVAAAASGPLYWRSKLMLAEPACLLKANLDAIAEPLLFLDIVFSFVKEKDTDNSTETKVELSFGFLMVESGKDNAQYIATDPVNKQQLEAHISSMQLDPHTVTADSLASTISKQLLLQGNSKEGRVTVDQSTSSLIDANIPYTAMGPGTKGKFSLNKDSDRCTTFNKSSLRLLYWDWVQNTHCGKAGGSPDDKKGSNTAKQTSSASAYEVMSAYDTWKRKPLPKKASAASSSSSSQVAASPSSATAAAAPAPAHAGKNTLAAKRRLKGMGGYGAGRKKKKGPVFQDSSDDDSD